LTGSQKVIGSIPIFSTENQRVATIVATLFYAYKQYTNNPEFWVIHGQLAYLI